MLKNLTDLIMIFIRIQKHLNSSITYDDIKITVY
jgi:hypothetical protein